jgi:Sec-independent protein translocase protein TatA
MYGLVDFVVIVVILVIVFGARWLPAAGAAIGRTLARRAARREAAAAHRQTEQGSAGE